MIEETFNTWLLLVLTHAEQGDSSGGVRCEVWGVWSWEMATQHHATLAAVQLAKTNNIKTADHHYGDCVNIFHTLSTTFGKETSEEVDNRFMNFVCKNILVPRVGKLVQIWGMYTSVMYSQCWPKLCLPLFPRHPNNNRNIPCERTEEDTINIYLEVFSGKLIIWT